MTSQSASIGHHDLFRHLREGGDPAITYIVDRLLDARTWLAFVYPNYQVAPVTQGTNWIPAFAGMTEAEDS